ncbi:hypothetical protein QYF36_022841 [Acer negundo]|nr:hypothetical protein QYF36_022841 [Acer negundo]
MRKNGDEESRMCLHWSGSAKTILAMSSLYYESKGTVDEHKSQGILRRAITIPNSLFGGVGLSRLGRAPKIVATTLSPGTSTANASIHLVPFYTPLTMFPNLLKNQSVNGTSKCLTWGSAWGTSAGSGAYGF